MDVESTLSFCPYCGEELELEIQNYRFCPKCGASLLDRQDNIQNSIESSPMDEQPMLHSKEPQASSVLSFGEKAIMKDECKFSYDAHKWSPGTLLYTDNEMIVFVTSYGLLNKHYVKHHSFNVDSIQNVRMESVSILSHNKTLVFEVIVPGRYTLYRYQGLSNPSEWVERINIAKQVGSVINRTIALLKSQPTTSFDEIKGYLKMESDESIINWLQTNISNKNVEGFIDKEKRVFTHILAYKPKTEIIQYTIATSFEFGKDGTLSIRCPRCGSPKQQSQRVSQVTCTYCGNTYVIPKKILDMI